MRLDKFLVSTGTVTRSEAIKLCRAGKVTVNGRAEKDSSVKIDPAKDEVFLLGKKTEYRKYTYIMMNKPEGVVSATEDGDVTVIDLLPQELRRIGLFPCGRLDKNTHGFVLLTNNGELAHFLLSPKHHVRKEYYFETKFPLSEEDRITLENGVDIGGYTTAPCNVILDGEKKGIITLTEGKYHQIKLMMTAVHNQITFLKRISFAEIALDTTLAEGSWRYLSDDEIKIIEHVF
ncbi:MAG: rRNA pseudouridine synthase [Ruminococcaceae bacterium]|nr:rRNA pseudouridine synthase [Oscillospiraceae bacterium]